MTPTSRVTRKDYDIAIIGAGPAGVCAAAAASGGAASVLLIDSSARLGGSVTAAMHRCMCGLYSSAPKDPLDTLNASAQRDIVRRMLAKEPSRVLPRQMGKAWVLEFLAPAWESSLAEICAESNADVRLGCRITALRRQGNRITAIQLQDKDQDLEPPWIDVKVLIDCTGGGAVLKLAGEDAVFPPDDSAGRILGGFAARLSGIDGDAELLRLQIPYALAQAVEKGLLPRVARFAVFYPGPAANEGICKLAVDPRELSNTDADSFMNRVVQHLIRQIPALANARIVEKSPRILPRDGLRLRGRFVVDDQHVLLARQFGPDAVHAWWPLERWDVAEGPTYAYPPVGRHYDIPDAALQSAAVENLLAAGACLSATSAAMASIRASGICLATGHAAGRLAATLLKDRG
ncbi:MAG: FAD-dependent oxidoreductase [Tepidisphaeraceae bacterium]|jgi:2-polyprenyl-6-methoxyphenol hydroxylase-like FAD-dependent oxidoreductase